MGITNLCKLLDPIFRPRTKPLPFDSLLVDCQSFLYVAIEHSLEADEESVFNEICELTWNQLRDLLRNFLHVSNLTVVLSFDGEGVPMKWPTQRSRRQSRSKKAFYRYILFGNNTLTSRVQHFVKERLKESDYAMEVVLCGCNVPGEGEHKIFQLAEVLEGCRNPIVVSVDQDVFVLALLRLHRYQSLQIYRYKKFYSVSPVQCLVDVSFLFGNDFIPPLVGITPTNASKIREALPTDGDPPSVLSRFLRDMSPHLRFTRVEYVDRLLVNSFWVTYFWIRDYYTRRRFPQMFLENRLYEAFDRNQLLTGLLEEAYSRSVYLEAKEAYADMVTERVPDAGRHVFTDESLLDRLKSYWREPENGRCTVLRLTQSDDGGEKSARSPTTGNERARRGRT